MTELSIFMLKNEKSSSINSFIDEKYLRYSSENLFENAEDINEFNLAIFPLDNQLRRNHNVTGKIFVLQEKQAEVRWLENVNSFSEKQIDFTTPNILNKPLIIIKTTSSSIYAISYSYGYTLLNREHVVPDFGLNIARKELKLHTIKRVKNTNFSDTLYVSNFSSNNKINLNEISTSQSIPNIVDEILGEMTIRFTDRNNNIKELNIFASSKDSIKINGNFSIEEDLVPILKQLGNTYRQRRSDRTFLDKEILAVPSRKKEYLNKHFDDYLSNLMVTFKKNSNEFKVNNLDKLFLDIPLNKVKFNIEDLEIRVHSIFRPGEYLNFFDNTQEEIFSKIFSFFLKNNVQEFVDKLKSINVSIKNRNSDSSKDTSIGNLFSCLYMELNHDSDKYILYQGDWLSVNKNVWRETRDFVNSISSEAHGIDFNEFNNEDADEGDYNIKISKLDSNKGLICVDKENFGNQNLDGGFPLYEINGRSQIEPCDILKVNENSAFFCHVKRGTATSGLSHLLSQARASCILIKKSEDFVNHINSVIKTELSESEAIFLNETNLKRSKIILGIIIPEKKVHFKNSKVFPVLFSLNLVALVNALSLEGFEVSLVKIPDKK